jgi:hypothetical protein
VTALEAPIQPPDEITALPPLQSPPTTVLKRIPETADDYGRVVVDLNPKWRVIECRDRVQWILQYRIRPPGHPRNDNWCGRSYCQTSEALIRCVREHAGEIDPAACTVLAGLPPRLMETR